MGSEMCIRDSLYADKMTNSLQAAIDETLRRRSIQEAFNKEHGITPRSVDKKINEGIEGEASAHREANAAVGRTDERVYVTQEYINELEKEMMAAAEQMEFERAAALRDRIIQLQDSIGKALDEVDVKSYDKKSRRRKREK